MEYRELESLCACLTEKHTSLCTNLAAIQRITNLVFSEYESQCNADLSEVRSFIQYLINDYAYANSIDLDAIRYACSDISSAATSFNHIALLRADLGDMLECKTSITVRSFNAND